MPDSTLYTYESLSIDDEISIENYEIPLLEAISRKYIYNIAVTGSYGAGKTSFLKAFQKKHPNYKYSFISLTNFKNNTELDTLEQEILKQIIYTSSHEETPLSNFRKLPTISFEDLKRKSWYFLFTIIFLWFIIYDYPKLLKGHLNLMELFSISWMLHFLYYSIFNFIKYKPINKINKLVIKDYEIDIGKDDKLVFNKYIDEIIYHFNSKESDLVIFEDLDRFKNTDILPKLRELNLLLNKQNGINNQLKKIVFIYAIGDKVFTCSEERTKFFDFILPIVPVINSFNAGSKFAEMMQGEDIEEDILFNLGFYISNIRELKNIKNEYLVYKNSLKLDKDHNKNILAMMILKNKYPQEFENLQFNLGLIYQILENKRELINKINKNNIELLEKHKEEILKLRDEVSAEKLGSIEELNLLYLNKIFDFCPSTRGFFIDSIGYNHIGTSLNIMKKDETFLKIFDGTLKIMVQDINGNNQPDLRLWDSSSKQEYYRRRDILTNEFDSKIHEYEETIRNLKNEIVKNETLPIADVIKKYTNLNNFSIEHSIDKPKWQELMEDINKDNNALLKFLLENSLIEEDSYQMYYSHFINGEYTQNDMKFILKLVTKGHEFNPEYKIDNPKSIKNKFKHNLNKNLMLNYDIAEYLAEENDQLLQEFALSLAKNENFFTFMSEFFNRMYYIDILDSTYKKLVIELLKSNKTYFEDLSKGYLGTRELNYILRVTLNSLLFSENRHLAESPYLKSLIEKSTTFIKTCVTNSIDNLKANLYEIKPCIKSFTYINSVNQNEKSIYDFIYTNSFYELNKENLESIYKNLIGEIDDCYNSQNYTTLMSRPGKIDKLCDYINDNINIYFENVHNKLDSNKENIDFILKLLENESLNLSYKEILIEKNEFVLPTFEDDYKKCWMSLVKNVRVNPTWKNVKKYFIYAEQVDEALITFINAKHEVLSEDTNFPEAYEFRLLLDSIIKTKDIPINILLSKIQKNVLDSIALNNVAKDKVQYLIESEILEFNRDNYDEILKTHDSLLVKFIKKNESTFIEDLLSSIEFSDNETFKILSSQEFSNDFKTRYINKINVKDINNKDILEQIWLVAKTSNEISFDADTLFQIMYYLKEIRSKVELICKLDNEYTNEFILRLLSKLGEPYSSLINDRQLILPHSIENEKLVAFLTQRDIVEYEIEGNNFFVELI